MNRPAILAILETLEACCLDDSTDREHVATIVEAMVAVAVQTEREACANILELSIDGDNDTLDQTLSAAIRQIRARNP